MWSGQLEGQALSEDGGDDDAEDGQAGDDIQSDDNRRGRAGCIDEATDCSIGHGCSWKRSDIEDLPSDILQLGNQLVELCAFVVDIGHAAAQFTHFGHKPRVVLQNVANRVERIAGRRVEGRVFDQVGGYIEEAAHNRDYMKFGADRIIIRTKFHMNLWSLCEA